MILNAIIVLVLLSCVAVFAWTLYRQCAGVAAQLRILRLVENVILLICDNPKHLLLLNTERSGLEFLEKAEAHQKKKSELSERKRTISLMQKERLMIEKLVGQANCAERP